MFQLQTCHQCLYSSPHKSKFFPLYLILSKHIYFLRKYLFYFESCTYDIVGSWIRWHSRASKVFKMFALHIVYLVWSPLHTALWPFLKWFLNTKPWVRTDQCWVWPQSKMNKNSMVFNMFVLFGSHTQLSVYVGPHVALGTHSALSAALALLWF